jgi:adenosylhomocysteinase
MDEYVINGKRIYVLGEGRLINLAAAEGHPPEIMSMSFMNQSLAMEYLVKHQKKLEARVYTLPQEIDDLVAQLQLDAMGVSIDSLTKKQSNYASSWTEGT